MNAFDKLSGSCSCGRYTYMVQVPSDSSARQQAAVHFHTYTSDRSSRSNLLSAYLHVPLLWFSSKTRPIYEDELPSYIAKTFETSGTQRKFCGYCGSHISQWTEEPREEQEFINLTVNSLDAHSLDGLGELELLPEDVDVVQLREQSTRRIESVGTRSTQIAQTSTDHGGMTRSSRSGNRGGISWFEDMIEGSQLGHHSKTSRGQGQSADGSTTVQWEVSEYHGNEPATHSAAGTKRKADDPESNV
ncbi:hypothetical protein LTR66_017422 [Elasticomyces elasticus]|nr:hypothetical protein LTR66_017422 [Elasticomyces elasticus]